MIFRQHIVVDVSDETFVTEPYNIDITGGIDISGLGRTIIRTNGTTEITDSIKLKHDSDNTVKLTPNNIDISGIGNIYLDTIGNAVFSCNNNDENNNTVTISSETIIIDTCNNTGLHIKKQPRHKANSSSGLLTNGDIVISDHGNCSATGDIAGIIQFEASPFNYDDSANSEFVVKCGQIALTHEGIVGNDTWGLTFNLLNENNNITSTYELLKLSGKNMVGVCGKDPERNLDVSGTFRVTNSNNYLNIDNSGDIISTGNLYIDKKIGIGTSTPESTLHIKSTTDSNPPNIKQSMNANNTSNVYNYCEFTNANESKTMGIEYDYYSSSGNTDTTTHMRMNILSNNGEQGNEIYNTGSTSYKNIMSILSSGEVGIGTTVPSNKLEVHGGPLGLALVDPTNYSNTTPIKRGVEYTTNNLLFKHDTHPWDDNSKYINTTAKLSSIMEVVPSANDNGKTSMGFFTASGSDNNMSLTEKMRITSGGNVGIGTTVPSNKLEVHGGPLGLALVDPTNYHHEHANDRDSDVITNNLLFKQDTDRWNASKYINTTAKISSILEAVTTASDSGKTSIGFFTATGGIDTVSLTEKMRITSTGSVGIGTTKPKTHLHMYASGHTDGRIITFSTGTPNGWGTAGYIDFCRNGSTTPYGGGNYSDYRIQGGETGIKFQKKNSSIADTNLITITDTGNVGIGTTAPTCMLDIVNTADNEVAELKIRGINQGTGKLFIGQSDAYGGGMIYNGDGNPDSNTSTDKTSFYRRNNYTDSEVFSYGWNDNTVKFEGEINATIVIASDYVRGKEGLWAGQTAFNGISAAGHLTAASATIPALSSGTQISGSVHSAQLFIKNPGSHNHMGIRLGGYNHPSFGGDDSADAWIHAASGLCINAAWNGVDTNKRLFLNDIATGDIYIGAGGGDVHVYNSMKIAGSGQSHHDWYLNNNNGTLWQGHSGGHSTGLYVTHAISCSQYFGNSDIRIKQDIKDVDDEEALTLLNRLSVKSYHYRDPVKRLRLPTIGFIAQECKEVLPNCISIDKGFIPDLQFEIIKPAYDEDNILTIPEIILAENDTGTFKFLVTNSVVSGVSDISSTEILISCETDEAGLKTNKFKFEKPYDHVMVIGREINDFHSIDKNMIFALNFDATKFLHRLVLKEKKKTAVLEEDNATLKEQMATMQAQMATMEADMAIVKEKLGL